MTEFMLVLTSFVFWYPLVMSVIWVAGALLFYIRREIKPPLPLNETPMVSIIVPCYNEEDTISETLNNLLELSYPDYEIIAINDGSSDGTEEILNECLKKSEKIRFINLKKNSGKANALYLGLVASNGEFLVTIDADALLDKDALNYMIPHFTVPKVGERVGAVTGNPRVRNRSSLLARIQLCEFSSIIGLIKRCQRILGKVMTVSGVVVAFRKRALLDCGLWDRDIITEDIGVTWKLQKRFWDIRYEPRAICWMLVPETLSGLWQQRVRWAQGGLEVILRHGDIFFDWRQRRLVPVYIEHILSVVWSLCWTITSILLLTVLLTKSNLIIPIFWSGSYLTLICLFQFLVGVLLDSKYDRSLIKYYLWAVWYPVLYWYFNAIVILSAIPKALKKKKKTFAVWESPDRGISLNENN